MFGQPKPFASLSSGLLARKGQARPAMRPQGFGGFGAPTEAMDDLGWNDMGEGAETSPPAPQPAPVPPVLRQREALEQEFTPEPQPEVAPAAEPQPEAAPAAEAVAPVTPKMVRAAVAKGPKAAFTLRLDAERHLRLRLASATQNRSAQLLVTQALDQFLATLPEVEELARHVADQPGKDVSGETR